MRKVIFPRTQAQPALSLLLSGGRFEVLEQTRSQSGDFAAFVLGRFGWSWGHFYRAAFCSLSPGSVDQLSLAITYLDVQKQWHGKNLFRGCDRGIEDEIAEYALAGIQGAKTA